MISDRKFKLLVPAAHGPQLKVSGKIGGCPDTRIIDNSGDCARSRLPHFLDNLVFTFGAIAASREIVQNFYLGREFFVVSNRMKDFMLGHFSKDEIEIKEVRVQHNDGTRSAESYFALKIVKTIDCIDPTLSTARRFRSEPLSFGQLITRYELEDELCAEFANEGRNIYKSYPRMWAGLERVHLLESVIPNDVDVFQPAFWPGYLIIDEKFGRLLESRCSGGTSGYYFWMLDLENVQRSHTELLQSLR